MTDLGKRENVRTIRNVKELEENALKRLKHVMAQPMMHCVKENVLAAFQHLQVNISQEVVIFIYTIMIILIT